MHSHNGKLHVAKSCLSPEAYKQTIANCNKSSEVNSLQSAIPGRGTRASSKNNFKFLKKMRSQDSGLNFMEFSHKPSEISPQGTILGMCSDPHLFSLGTMVICISSGMGH